MFRYFIDDLIEAIRAYIGSLGSELPLMSGEAWEDYYRAKVAPLRERLLATKMGEVPESERGRASFVLKHKDAISFIQAISIYPPFTVQHLCSFIDRYSAKAA